MYQKGQINKVFVYLLSVIMILFVGFLVSQFIFTFQDDVKADVINRIYETIERDQEAVYQSYGSERTFDYRVPDRFKTVCFVSDVDACFSAGGPDLNVEEPIPETLEEIIRAGGENSVMFSETNSVLSSRQLQQFETSDGCFCTVPTGNRFTLTYENRRNTLWIYDEKNESTSSSPIP
jgi:hypothetical protein